MGRLILLVIGVALGALLIVFVLVLAGRGESEASLGQLPPLTMVYEVYGPSITVGDRSVEPFRELHRLEYRSKTEWTDTVIQSPSIDRGQYGVGSNLGSYTRLNGNSLTEYDAMDGSTDESTVADDTVFVPNAAFAFALETPNPMGDAPRLAISQVVTSARVCFNGECEENVGGTRYRSGGMDLVLLERDSWTVPLQLGDRFLARTVEVQAARE